MSQTVEVSRTRYLVNAVAGLVGLLVIAGLVLLAISALFSPRDTAMTDTTVVVLAVVVGVPVVVFGLRSHRPGR